MCILIFTSFRMIGSFNSVEKFNKTNMSTLCIIFLRNGVCMSLCATFFMYATLITKKHGTLSLMWYLNVIISYFYEIFILQEIPNAFSVFGSICTLIGLIIIL